MPTAGWRWKEGLVAVAAGSCLFLLCIQLAGGANMSDPGDALPVTAFYVVFAPLVFWLFGRPEK
jgi:hypothetical protein